ALPVGSYESPRSAVVRHSYMDSSNFAITSGGSGTQTFQWMPSTMMHWPLVRHPGHVGTSSGKKNPWMLHCRHRTDLPGPTNLNRARHFGQMRSLLSTTLRSLIFRFFEE